MKNNLVIIIGIVVLILLMLFGYSKLNFSLTKSWEITLDQTSKDPYGLYIAHKEIGNLSKGKIKELEKISELNIDKTNASDYALVIIGKEVFLDSISKKYISDLVKNGGIVFISDYQDNTDDTIYTAYKDIKGNFELSLKDKYLISNKKDIQHHYIEKYNARNHEVLGTININNKLYPNFIKYQPNKAKGYFLYHTEPIYFSNYYLLNQDSYFYSKTIFQSLKGKTILWYNTEKTYAGAANTSVMRFIMSQPALKYSWISLLILLFLFLIFKSKREQRIIPVIEKEENHSLEFAKTISSLYQENGETKDIINKKIDYFLYQLRKSFMIETDDLMNKKFIELVAQKANISQEECLNDFLIIKNSYEKQHPTIHDLKNVYQIIENYKQKANIS